MPLVYCTMAPGDGQAFRQPGSAQCMQPSFRISHSRLPVASFSYSVNRITVQVLPFRSVGLLYVPLVVLTTSGPNGVSTMSGRRSFHSMQAD